MIKSWISFCQSKHKRRCDPLPTEIVKKLRVIDVDALNVIAAPEKCEYVALSYVWGAQPVTTPRKFPRVVEDSFVVTKKLGYKYLWVDKYCIDQDSVADKHDQVKAMHLVYGNARLTLIAAAGEDSEYGLPGVGCRERVEQNALSIGDYLYIRTFPHASSALDASRWATRGWTLQEGILSNRRLIFTDHQVSFRCNGMHCSEAVHWPYKLMHAKSSHRFPENVPRPPFGRLALDQSYYREYANLLRILEEYSNRDLSYASDSLNAFLGILSSFANRTDPIYHVWGVPLVSDDGGWDLMLHWRHRQPCNRQPRFPSWSWAGWSGPVTPSRLNFDGPGNYPTRLEDDSRGEKAEPLDLQTLGEEYGKYHMYATRLPILRLTIWVVDLQFTHVSWSGFSEAAKKAYYSKKSFLDPSANDAFKEGLYAKFPERGYTELAYFYIDDNAFDTGFLRDTSLPAMKFDVEGMTTFIVLVHRGEDRYERLGIVMVSSTSMRPNADVAFQLDNGILTKVQPHIPPGVGEPRQSVWNRGWREMDIRLG
ncbi:hypothetical protein NKR23_g3711 [Pleurostoma richardsiae]|uniref:Heterokaryon incompatibility domain-containing protein n=1 Tax=Pleurostoma richardsiae TaxID=41990 RepID=A0AA38VSY5_9PEZI|nr:hypothetical protein NKR23_g3711 [Pleurostoma richardsiae]